MLSLKKKKMVMNLHEFITNWNNSPYTAQIILIYRNPLKLLTNCAC